MNFTLNCSAPSEGSSIDPVPLDKQKIAHAFGRAAHSYEQHNELQRRSGNALLALLDTHLTRHSPANTITANPSSTNTAPLGLDLGCGSGWFLPALALRAQQLLALDLSANMLQQAQHKANIMPICADMDTAPLAKYSLDWIFANLCMQWSSDSAAWLANWSQRLKPGGVLVFATLVEGSLCELSNCWQRQGQANPVNRFITQQALTQQLTATGLRWHCYVAPETLAYPNLKALLQDLKGIGANRVNQGRRLGLMGKQTWQQLNATYPVNHQGQCVATYQLAYGVIYG